MGVVQGIHRRSPMQVACKDREVSRGAKRLFKVPIRAVRDRTRALPASIFGVVRRTIEGKGHETQKLGPSRRLCRVSSTSRQHAIFLGASVSRRKVKAWGTQAPRERSNIEERHAFTRRSGKRPNMRQSTLCAAREFFIDYWHFAMFRVHYLNRSDH